METYCSWIFLCKKKTTVVLNLLLSSVALKIYKYKMFCRLENKEETSEGLLNNLKSVISQYSETLSATQDTKQSSFFKKMLLKFESSEYTV
jgi:hypothetical protein